jgi:hypothetical protein
METQPDNLRKPGSVVHGQRGIETIEWIALAAVILALLAGMLFLASPMGQAVSASIFGKTSQWVGLWTGGEKAGDGVSVQPASNTETAGGGTDAGGSILGTAWRHVKGAGRAVGETLWGAVEGIWNTAKFGYNYATDPNYRNQTHQTLGAMWDAAKQDPLGFAWRAGYNIFLRDIHEAWQKGEYGEALTHAFLNFGGVSKIGKLAQAGKLGSTAQKFTQIASTAAESEKYAKWVDRIDKVGKIYDVGDNLKKIQDGLSPSDPQLGDRIGQLYNKVKDVPGSDALIHNMQVGLYTGHTNDPVFQGGLATLEDAARRIDNGETIDHLP